jgi:hypothetical protein
METKDLSIDQVSGAVLAHGPGWLKTVRRGKPKMPAAGGVSNDGRRAADDVGLTFLLVRFARELSGNMNNRQISLSDQVRAVHGPVKDWHDTLDPDDPKVLAEHVTTLACDRLTVTQMLLDARRNQTSLELEAVGSTIVEGSTFAARAHRISFADAKDLLVMEGNGRDEARLYRQARVGGLRTEASARRLLYWPQTGRVEADATYLNLDQLPSGGRPKPRPPAR